MDATPSESAGPGDTAAAAKAAARPGTALVAFKASPEKGGFTLAPKHGLWLGAIAAAMLAGGLGTEAIRWAAHPARPVVTAQSVQRLQEDVTRLRASVDTIKTASESTKQDDSIRSLKKSVENLRQQVEQARANDGANLAQLSSKLDKADRDPGGKLAEIVARLDKLDGKDKPDAASQKLAESASQKVADVANRLDRLERQVSSAAPTGAVPPAAGKMATPPTAVPAPAPVPPVKPTAAAKPELPAAAPAPKPAAAAKDTTVVAAVEPKAAPRPATVDGWVLRDVYDGLALVEARRGDLREVSPGEFLPGAGAVRSIERHGRAWVVLTDRGVIANNTF